MQRLQFSISTLLIGTAAVATWLSVMLVFTRSSGAWSIALIQLLTLGSITWGNHRILRNTPNAWTISALVAGVFVLAVLFFVWLSGNPAIRFFD
ncbi:MAG: hypothetical protein WD669_11255 [Pirellulales bacterium]